MAVRHLKLPQIVGSLAVPHPFLRDRQEARLSEVQTGPLERRPSLLVIRSQERKVYLGVEHRSLVVQSDIHCHYC